MTSSRTDRTPCGSLARAATSAALGAAGLGAAHALLACGAGCGACGLCLAVPLLSGTLLLAGAAAEGAVWLRQTWNGRRGQIESRRRPGLLLLLLCAVLPGMVARPATAAAPAAGAGWFVLSPAPGKGRPTGQPAVESEHRPVPFRSYIVGATGLAPDVQALVRRPNGSVEPARIQTDEAGRTIASFPTSMGDGPAHGPNNLYVIERRSDGSGGTAIRVAKWTTVHHSCGWGHPYKFDPSRRNAPPLVSVPLEIVAEELIDGNFHAATRSGDVLHLRVFSHGELVAGALVRVVTARGWTRELRTDALGSAEVQLIRDYYPTGWDEFHADHRDPLTIIAERAWEEGGAPVRATTSFVWHCSPARRDYASYSAGLSLGAGGLLVTVAGVYAYRERRTRPLREEVLRERD